MRIKVNIAPMVRDITARLPTESDKKRIIAGLGAAAYQFWTKLAQTQLKSSSRDYVNALVYAVDDSRATVALVGQIPNMIENGWPGGDMKGYLLSGKNVKHSKDGTPYNTVPFRHGAPTSSGRNTGAQMPMSIYKVAQKLAPTISRPMSEQGKAGGTQWGGRLHPGLPMKDLTRKVLTRKMQPWHKSGVYEGMVRKAQPTAAGKLQTSGYTTFRRVSAKSDPKAFIHPGIAPRKFAKQVSRYVEKIAADVVQKAIAIKPRQGSK